MGDYAGRTTFTSGAFAIVAVLAAEALFVTGAAWTYGVRGWTFTSIGLTGMSLFGLAAILDTLTQRVVLEDDRLVVGRFWGSQSYAREQIVQVSDAKGSPTSMRLADGRIVRLPFVGNSMGTSIRAWLKSGGASA